MLRNPTDMLYSLHSQKLYNGTENIRNFEEALDAEEDRRKGRRIPRLCRFPKGLLYTEVVKYTEQVERYMEVFGREKVMVIIFDDFVSDTAGVYKETLEFLGVDANFSLPTYQTFNPNTVPRSKVLTTTINIISYFGHNFFRPLPPPANLGIVKRLTQLNTKYQSRPQMDVALRRRLQRHFSPEVSRLSALLGRDLMDWVKE